MSENKLKWENLMTTDHITSDNSTNNNVKVNDFQDDYMAVISSQSFRALQDKTQVFPLDKGDYVRTRLTHSIEVSTVARQLVLEIFDEVQLLDNKEKWKEFYDDVVKEINYGTYNSRNAKLKRGDDSKFKDELYREHIEQIETVAACAGLLHDMGNPPFGHYGESMIRTWFEEQFGKGRFVELNDSQKADFIKFEGNAQALRLLCKINLEKKYDEHMKEAIEKKEIKKKEKKRYYNIDVSYPVINAIIKYPNPSDEKFDSKDKNVCLHKNGFYQAEKEMMDEIAGKTGTKIEDKYVRHPITYIMEASDDIAYTTADLADSVKKEIFNLEQFIAYYRDNFFEQLDKKADKYNEKASNEYVHLMKFTMERVKNLKEGTTKRIDSLKKNVDYNRSDTYRAKCDEIKRWAGEGFNPEEFSKNFITWLEPLEKIDELEKSINKIDVKSGEAFLLFESWLKDLRDYLIENAADMFRDQYKDIIEGTYEGDLFSLTGNDECLDVSANEFNANPGKYFPGTVAGDTLNIMKDIMKDNVYDSTEIVNLEISAKGAVETLLATFTDVMLRYKPTKVEKPTRYIIKDSSDMGVVYDRFLHVIPDNLLLDFVHKYTLIMEDKEMKPEDKNGEILYYKLLTVTDFVSGMTDSYATNLAKLIRGID